MFISPMSGIVLCAKQNSVNAWAILMRMYIKIAIITSYHFGSWLWAIFPFISLALFVFCTKSRRAERYWQKTLLQMEEMESQIREEIRKGNFL